MKFNTFSLNKHFYIFTLLIIFLAFDNYSFSYSKCGTHSRLHLNKDSLQNEINYKFRKLNRTLEEIRERRSLLQKFIDTPNGRFRIHYDTTGSEKVPSLDANNNNIPDYVDSVVYFIEKIYEFQVNQLGFTDPTLRDGNQEISGGSAAYDIFIRQLGDYKSTVVDSPGYYGMVDNDQVYDNKNGIIRQTSYMIIDNDYSQLDTSFKENEITKKRAYNTFGYEALKVTLAHEFHHSIQMFYAVNQFLTLSEMFSTYMEWRMFPEIKDYVQYTRNLLNNEAYTHLYTLTNLGDGYEFSTFGQYIYKKYGDDFWLKFWERHGNGENDFGSLNELLIEQNSNLKEAWCDYTNWFYYTGERAIEGQYFDDAKIFPKVKYYDTLTYSPPSISATLHLRPLSFSFSRVVFDGSDYTSGDTLVLKITNCDVESAINYDFAKTQRYDLSVVNNNFSNSTYEQLGSSKYYYKIDLDSGLCINKYYFPGISTEIVKKTTPNPYNKNTDEFILFPCDEEIPLFEEIVLNIYNLEMITIFSQKIKVSTYEQLRGVILSKNEFQLDNGNYIFSVEYKDKVSLGKFIVKNM